MPTYPCLDEAKVIVMLDEQEFREQIQAILSSWLLPKLDLQQYIEKLFLLQQVYQDAAKPETMTFQDAIATLLRTEINALKEVSPKEGAILAYRFLDGETLKETAKKIGESPDSTKYRQSGAIEILAQRLYTKEKALRQATLEKEESLRQAQIAQQRLALHPVPPTRLFGVADLIDLLSEKLLPAGPPYYLAVTGIGGIGKTSLTNAVVQQAIETLAFERILWLNVADMFPHAPTSQPEKPRPTLTGLLSRIGSPEAERSPDFASLPLANRSSLQRFVAYLAPQLGIPSEMDIFEQQHRVLQTLQAAAYLIVIDGAETETQMSNLLDVVGKIGKPSKFLITSRVRPIGQINALEMYTLVLSELSIQNAGDLIRYHAHVVGTKELEQASPETVQEIYNKVGGNPLALKLIIGQAQTLPFAEILRGVGGVHSLPMENIYRHIYQQAWQTLSKPAKVLLQKMPLADESTGMSITQMQALSGLMASDLVVAMDELIRRSLLEPRGTTNKRRYAIHRLTETFLLEEIVN
jgi:hypothetical protein